MTRDHLALIPAVYLLASVLVFAYVGWYDSPVMFTTWILVVVMQAVAIRALLYVSAN